MAQRLFLQMGLYGLDFILKAAGDPERAANRLFILNRRLSGLKIRHQRVGETRWPYLEGGTGEHVLLLHGFGADKDRFGALGPFLRQRYHVVIPDLPGFGDQLPNWSLDYGIDTQVRRLDNFIRATGIDPCHMMGISLGGYLAGCYTAQFPERVKSLCLMDSAGFSSPVSSDAWELFNLHQRNIFLPSSVRQMQDMVDYLMDCPLRLPKTLNRYWTQMVLEQLPWRQKLFGDLADNGMERLDDLAGAIKVPTLVVWGAQDRVCHVSTVENIMHLIDDCRAFIIHGCGHIPIVEHPRLVRLLYGDFLREISDAST